MACQWRMCAYEKCVFSSGLRKARVDTNSSMQLKSNRSTVQYYQWLSHAGTIGNTKTNRLTHQRMMLEQHSKFLLKGHCNLQSVTAGRSKWMTVFALSNYGSRDLAAVRTLVFSAMCPMSSSTRHLWRTPNIKTRRREQIHLFIFKSLRTRVCKTILVRGGTRVLCRPAEYIA